MEEKDSDYFFGRKRETVECSPRLPPRADRLPVLIGNSGVGKSSLAQAGVLAALKRQAWPEEAGARMRGRGVPGQPPMVLSCRSSPEPIRSRRWSKSFLDTWQFAATDPERVKQQNGWIELLRDGKATLARSDRRHRAPPQGTRSAQAAGASFSTSIRARSFMCAPRSSQRRRFSELLAQALPDPRLRAMMSMRSDFLGHLQNDKPLFKARQQIDVPPLREEELREVVSRPAQLLSARFETERLDRHHQPAHRRGFGQGRGRPAAAVLHARRHVDADGAAR